LKFESFSSNQKYPSKEVISKKSNETFDTQTSKDKIYVCSRISINREEFKSKDQRVDVDQIKKLVQLKDL